MYEKLDFKRMRVKAENDEISPAGETPDAATTATKATNPPPNISGETPDAATTATKATESSRHGRKSISPVGGKKQKEPSQAEGAKKPSTSSDQSLKEQGDYCASRGMDYLKAFCANLSLEEMRAAGGKPQLAKWKAIARDAIKATEMIGCETRAEWVASHKSGSSGRNVINPSTRAQGPELPVVPFGVPRVLRAPWEAFKAQCPAGATDQDWRQAVADGEALFSNPVHCHSLAAFNWEPRHLFAVPKTDGTAGLLWFAKGRTITCVGPGHAGLGHHSQSYDRRTAREWFNPFGAGH